MAATTIAQEITRLTTAKADIKTAIEGKGVTVPSSTLLDGYASLVTQIQQGGAEEAPENDVNFYDYTGFRVASYTIADAKALTALPTPPSHDGLTFQEWNWTLVDIVAYNRRYIDIGANYEPTDGKTKVSIKTFSTNNLSDITLVTRIDSAKHINIDWGDGSTIQNITSAGTNTDVKTSHVYTSPNNYVIKVWAQETGATYTCEAVDDNCIVNEVNFSSEIRNIWCRNQDCLVTIPKAAKGAFTITNSTIPQITIPRSSTIDFTDTGACRSEVLHFCFAPTLPKITGNYIFQNIRRTKRLVIPEFTTSGSVNLGVFGSLLSVEKVSVPSSLSFVAGTNANFNACNLLREIEIVQGWVPNTSMSFNTDTQLLSSEIESFFSKLGTTSTAITLTFGSTNLNKLTADQKAIATNKGYTLA